MDSAELIGTLARDVIAFADSEGLGEGLVDLGVGGLSVSRARSPSELADVLYSPMMCLVLSGRKSSALGERSVTFGAGDALIVGVEALARSRIDAASQVTPYASVGVNLDLQVARDLLTELDPRIEEHDQPYSIAVGPSSVDLVDAVRRLFGLTQRGATTRRVLEPLLVREVHFLMLQAGHAGMLRRLCKPRSAESRILAAVSRLKATFRDSLSVDELAATAGMSVSGFHAHFKNLTSASPLQYQKSLRLMHARGLLRHSSSSISSIAYEVGYASAAQFSRDYARKYGRSPSRDRVTDHVEDG